MLMLSTRVKKKQNKENETKIERQNKKQQKNGTIIKTKQKQMNQNVAVKILIHVLMA